MSQCMNSPDMDQHSLTLPTTATESPPTSTMISLDTIDTVSSSDSSGIIKENASILSWSPLVESMNTRPPQSTTPGPFTLHKRFFFKDGNITFLVDGTLYRVHRYFFCRDSNEFITRLSHLAPQEQASDPAISLENVKTQDFDAFLSVLYPLDFNVPAERSFEELQSILDLSTRWGFASIREMAIRCMDLKPPTSVQRLVLGRKYAIEDWVLPALQELCERPLPLALDEARLMNVDDVVLVGSVRESVRSQEPTVASTGIMDCIKALRSGKPWQRQSVPPGSGLFFSNFGSVTPNVIPTP